MTLVNTETGELVERLTSEQARHLTNEIKGALIVAWDKLVQAWRGRADLALGYASWDAYCAGEFAEARMVRLPREQRQELVAEMRREGMSTRAIGAGLGVDQKTVVNDLRRSTEEDSSVATVTSLDGRQRPATTTPKVPAVEQVPEQPQGPTDTVGAESIKRPAPASVSTAGAPGAAPTRPLTAREINAMTPQDLIDERNAEAERALPAYGIRMAIDDLLSEPSPETVVRTCPADDLDQLARVPEAIAYLTALDTAMEARR